jgi:hypothetical protein
MQSRNGKGQGVREARMHAGEPAKYKIERWDLKDGRVEEVVASASLIMIGHAACSRHRRAVSGRA